MKNTAFAEALALREAGQIADAAARCRAILGRDPNHVDSLHLLGLITAEHSDPEAGIALIRQAMAIHPRCGMFHHSLALGYYRLGRLEDAIADYRTAAALLPNAPEIHCNLATALRALGRQGEAIEHYRQAVALAPDTPDPWYNLANALAESNQSAGAEMYFRKAIELKPDFVNALGNYGRWLIRHARFVEAQRIFTQLVCVAPRDAAAWNYLGIAVHKQGRRPAEGCYRRAIDIDPGMADAHKNLGHWLFDQGRTDDAIACFQTATSVNPESGTGQLASCMGQIPIVYRAQAEVAERRARYTKALEDLGSVAASSLAGVIGGAQPFFLPYQGEDDRALQSSYGELAYRALADIEPPARLANPPKSGERIRLGIVSGCFCDHTLFKLFLESWLTKLNRSRFEVFGFHTGWATDAETARCANMCDRFVQNLPSPAAFRTAITTIAPHVLLYPEVGIDPIAGRLAAMRLAPLQCVAWGHPVTTGMPTIDYFLSSELMEPPDGDAHYTERMVRLPNLGMSYSPDASRVKPIDPGPRADGPVFWSGQSLYKYLPRYDAIFTRIAAEVGACKFIFVGFPSSQAVTNIFRDRLGKAFAAAGLDGDMHIVILPQMSQQDYIDAAGRADIILDTPGWSGGKSTLDCLVHDPAIVTWPGKFMRGRHTAAILRRIGCEATIADSEDEYVSIAVRLARDTVWRSEVRQAVARGKHLAFDDLAYMRALETFLVEAVSTPA